MLNTKKGIELSQAFAAVLVVVLVAVLVIIAIFLFQTLPASLGSNVGNVTNETIGAVNNVTARGVAQVGACNLGSFAVATVYNGTFGDAVNAGNYTVGSTGTILLTDAGNIIYNGSEAFNVTYTYTFGGDACNASNTMLTEFATYPALVGLVGTIVFLGLVIGVLVASFLFGGRREV